MRQNSNAVLGCAAGWHDGISIREQVEVQRPRRIGDSAHPAKLLFYFM